MRPQHITAENVEQGPEISRGMQLTSMRPQHITAENWSDRRPPARRATHFNEAAAYHCGKPPGPPRPDERSRHFNEAAAYHCGKLGVTGPELSGIARLQ